MVFCCKLCEGDGDGSGSGMADDLVCWKCGAAIAELPMPLARLAECPACRADLHVCQLCEYFDTRVAKGCREPVADEVQDKARANFCGYFQVKAGAYGGPRDTASQAARGQVEALFGANPRQSEEDENKAVSRSEADIARERLERLFNPGGERKK